MTPFVKEDFNWDGEYLTYSGAYNGCKMMLDVHPDAHPSWAGKRKPAFVARFKYNKGERRHFQKFLIENFTCEEYFGHMEKYNMSPLNVLIGKGYMTLAQKRAEQSGDYNALMSANY